MRKKILIIDDSALMRRVLSDIVESDDRFTIMGAAVDGLEALEIMERHASEIDALLLDINMPRMNGLNFLRELNQRDISATVIVVSTIAKSEAKETILALELGAFDFVTKPESYEGLKNNRFAEQIIECLENAMKLGNNRFRPESTANTPVKELRDTALQQNSFPVVVSKRRKSSGSGDGKLVAIACSTGGPKALYAILSKLPENLDAPVLIVQHMPAGFTKSLADRINEVSRVFVKEAEDGDALRKGVVYIAKGGHQMRLIKNQQGEYRIRVTKEAPRHSLLPCADIMYESLVDTDFDEITCVVLTGMGNDATEGIKELDQKKKNIYVIAQNEESCIVYGMPKAIAEAALVDEVVALSGISEAITRNVGVQ